MSDTTHDAPAASLRLEEILKHVDGQSYPPVHLWNPEFCGDIDMQIKRDGTWFYMGTPIGRKRMVRLFSTVLRRDEDGKTYLVTPVEKIGITVDDAHFVAVTMDVVGEGEDQVISFTTNVDDTLILDKNHPMRVDIAPDTQEPSPYVVVRDRLEALIGRSIFYELVGRAVDRGGKLGVWSSGIFWVIGDAP